MQLLSYFTSDINDMHFLTFHLLVYFVKRFRQSQEILHPRFSASALISVRKHNAILPDRDSSYLSEMYIACLWSRLFPLNSLISFSSDNSGHKLAKASRQKEREKGDRVKQSSVVFNIRIVPSLPDSDRFLLIFEGRSRQPSQSIYDVI